MLMGQDMYTGGEKRKKKRFMYRHVIARHRNPSWKAIKPSKKIGKETRIHNNRYFLLKYGTEESATVYANFYNGLGIACDSRSNVD